MPSAVGRARVFRAMATLARSSPVRLSGYTGRPVGFGRHIAANRNGFHMRGEWAGVITVLPASEGGGPDALTVCRIETIDSGSRSLVAHFHIRPTPPLIVSAHATVWQMPTPHRPIGASTAPH